MNFVSWNKYTTQLARLSSLKVSAGFVITVAMLNLRSPN